MKCAVILNPCRVNMNTVNQLCSKLDNLHIDTYFCKNEERCSYKYPKLCYDELLEKCDIIIALGGDGTILHAAKDAALLSKPVLGINAGRLGFCANIESDELELLNKLVNGEYWVEKRNLLCVDVIDKEMSQRHYCINDAVISKGALSRIIDVDLSFKNNDVLSYHSDGVIISTPTGSTAYSLSAGGPIMYPSCSGTIITPICAHSFLSRPLVVSADETINITTRCPEGCEAYLTIDGEKAILLSETRKTVISKADITANLIKLKDESFIHILHEKLGNGGL